MSGFVNAQHCFSKGLFIHWLISRHEQLMCLQPQLYFRNRNLAFVRCTEWTWLPPLQPPLNQTLLLLTKKIAAMLWFKNTVDFWLFLTLFCKHFSSQWDKTKVNLTLVKEQESKQELEVWMEVRIERPFGPCTQQSLSGKALPSNTELLLTAAIMLWMTIQLQYSGNSRDETWLSYFSPGCELRLRAKDTKM